MDIRYDLSFMKEYAEVFKLDNKFLASKFHCGVKTVDKILNGELQIKDSFIDEILYEFGYRNYEEFKNGILEKTRIRKENEKNVKESNNKTSKPSSNNSVVNKPVIKEEIKKSPTTEPIKQEKIIEPKKTYEGFIRDKIILKDNIDENMSVIDMFDYNKMKNFDRIIISLLCDEHRIYSIKQIAEFLCVDEKYVKTIYKNVLKTINEDVKVKTKA